jgi:uncharacterized protein (TIGR02246 family)
MTKLRPFFYVIALVAYSCLPTNVVFAQSKKDETAIRSVFAAQEAAWNTADLAGFMQGYWQSDDLSFIGKSGITKGWQATLDNYKKSYPNAEAMGILDFTVLSIEFLSHKTAYVVGKWHLKRTDGDLAGHFTLIWKKINGKWLIVADHSS